MHNFIHASISKVWFLLLALQGEIQHQFKATDGAI